MTARATFRQSDLERALRAAKAAELIVAGFEITPDGRIIIRTAKDAEDEQPKGWGE